MAHGQSTGGDGTRAVTTCWRGRPEVSFLCRFFFFFSSSFYSSLLDFSVDGRLLAVPPDNDRSAYRSIVGSVYTGLYETLP
ncbi:hypothetical protein BHE74_00048860, partial [Ensete ventricosum]